MNEYGWAIEGAWSHVQSPDYWVGSSAWSTDHNRALRFARKQDAEQAAAMMLDGIRVRICEHAWTRTRMDTSKGRAQSAREPRYQERPTAADSAVGTTETVTDSASVQHEPDPPYGSEAYLFRELMAIMHDDGGHYHAQHGAQKAYEDACTKYWRLVVTAEKTAKDVRATDEAGVTTDRESESP